MAQEPLAGIGLAARRSRLRLVPEEAADAGPISPELVLVCPELAEAARAALPDPPWGPPARAAAALEPRPDAPAGPPPLARAGTDVVLSRRFEVPELPASGERLLLDTLDLRLGEHGMSLECRRDAETLTWTLSLPRGERVEARGEAVPGRVPAEISALLRAVTGGEGLEPVPWHAGDAEIARVQAQVREQRRALLRHDPGSRLGDDPENLHQLRVASRRLRAFLRVARAALDPAWVASVRAELGKVAAASGPVRDLDVLIENLRAETRVLDTAEQPGGLALLAELESERRRLQVELVRALDEPAYLDLLESLAGPVRVVSQPVRIALRKRAARDLRKLVAEVQRLGDSPADEALHSLRIRVKRVRYAAELAGGRARRRAARVIDAAKLLQDLLGEHQDAAVAEARLRGLVEQSASPPVAFVAGRLAERQRVRRGELRRELPAAWERLRRAARKHA